MVARSVEVDFDAEVGGFVAGLAEADAALGKVDRKLNDLDNNDSLGNLGVEAAAAGAGLAVLGHEAESTNRKLGNQGRSLGTLEQQLTSARAEVKRLGEEFVRTGDADVLKAWRKASRDLGTLQRVGKSLGDSVEQGVSDGGRRGVANVAKEVKKEAADIPDFFGSGLVKGFAELPPELQAALAAGAVAAAPLIGAALNAAVLAGVGGGALATGILIAARDPRVQAAGAELGQHLLGGLEQASGPMISAVMAGINTLRSGFDSIQPSIARIFATISPYVDRLAQGLVGMFQQMMPGIESAVRAAGPLLGALADEMPAIGQAIGFFFEQIAQGGPGAVMFLRDFLQGLEVMIGALGVAIKWLSQAYFWLSAFAHAMSGDFVTASVSAAQAMKITSGSMQQVTTTTQAAHQAFGELTADFSALSDTGIQVTQAAIGWRAALANVNAAVKANGTDLRLSTEAGRANQQMIVDSVQAARRSYDANIKNHMSINAATSAYQSQIAALRNHLVQLGFNRAAVDRLIRTLAAVPPTVKTKAEVATAAAHNAINVLQRAINNIHGKQVRIDAATGAAQHALDAIRGAINGIVGKTVYVNVVGSHTNLPQRWGGIVAAERGLINAGIYTRPMVSFAEPATGGEAYVPRLGDYRRSTAILDQAARWYGGRFMPGGGGGSATVVVQLTNHGVIGNRIELENWLAKSVSNLARQGRI